MTELEPHVSTATWADEVDDADEGESSFIFINCKLSVSKINMPVFVMLCIMDMHADAALGTNRC